MDGGVFDRNQEATCYVGDLDSQVDEALLWELCVQCGPVVNVHIPKDKLTQQHMGFGFVEFKGQQDAEYAIKVLNMLKMHGKPIRVNAASKENETLDVGVKPASATTPSRHAPRARRSATFLSRRRADPPPPRLEPIRGQPRPGG